MIFLKKLSDILVTYLLWFYFLAGLITLLIFFPVILLLSLFFSQKETLFRCIIYFFLKTFFFLLKRITPGLKIQIHDFDQIKKIRSSIILCNHVSYLDALLILSLNPKTVAVIKGGFFKTPVLGWIVNKAGFIPSIDRLESDLIGIQRMEKLDELLNKGQNVLIFPEGTRNNGKELGKLKLGAFKLAEKFKAPIILLLIKNTQILFQRGKFLYNTCILNQIQVRQVGQILPGECAKKMKEQAVKIFSETI